ncbi:haloacid dehalogenase-like hydrolase [Gracilaria domingensis]|nr:haloacid dehalogenase-like hydrolase [Gracilaria domingensis]
MYNSEVRAQEVTSQQLANEIFENGYAVITDIDGTLKRAGENIPAETVKCMKYINALVGFRIVTGRDIEDAESFMEHLGGYTFGISGNQGARVRLSNGTEIDQDLDREGYERCAAELERLALSLNESHGLHEERQQAVVSTRKDSGLPNFTYNGLSKWKTEANSGISKVLTSFPNLVAYPQDENCDIGDIRFTKNSGALALVENDPQFDTHLIVAFGNASNDGPLYEMATLAVHVKGDDPPPANCTGTENASVNGLEMLLEFVSSATMPLILSYDMRSQ